MNKILKKVIQNAPKNDKSKMFLVLRWHIVNWKLENQFSKGIHDRLKPGIWKQEIWSSKLKNALCPFVSRGFWVIIFINLQWKRRNPLKSQCDKKNCVKKNNINRRIKILVENHKNFYRESSKCIIIWKGEKNILWIHYLLVFGSFDVTKSLLIYGTPLYSS